MKASVVLALLMCAAISGCQYGYSVTAVLQNGVLHFTASRPLFGDRCVRGIEVVAHAGPNATASHGDDALRISHGAYWYEAVDFDDDCANKFPLAYGIALRGEALMSAPHGRVSPKPLAPGEYLVIAQTGATGRGFGRFVVYADGRVENLRR